MTDSEKIIELLKQRRIEQGYSRAHVARRAGLSAEMIAKYESGYRHPNLERLVAWSNAVNLRLTLMTY